MKNQLRDWSNLEMEIILNEKPLILFRTPVAHFLEWKYFRQPQLRINPLNGPKLLWQGWPILMSREKILKSAIGRSGFLAGVRDDWR